MADYVTFPPFINSPRIYSGMPKRLGRKYAGDSDRDRRHLQWMASLTPGDVINNCSGLNHVIEEEVEIWWGRPVLKRRKGHGDRGYGTLKRGLVIRGIDFQTAGSGGCSGFHCGIIPALNQTQLLAQFKAYGWDKPIEREVGNDDTFPSIAERLARGDKVLDDDLLLIPQSWDKERVHEQYELNVKALEKFGKRKQAR